MKTKRTTRSNETVCPLPFPGQPATGPAPVAHAPSATATPAELKHWMQRAEDLPDIRWEKVQAMREAIRCEAFDQDERLAGLADALPSELMDYLAAMGERE